MQIVSGDPKHIRQTVHTALIDAFAASRSVILIDPDGDVAPDTTPIAPHMGYEVAVHDPTNPDSLPFNLLHVLPDAALSMRLAHSLMDNDSPDAPHAHWLLADLLRRLPSLAAVHDALQKQQRGAPGDTQPFSIALDALRGWAAPTARRQTERHLLDLTVRHEQLRPACTAFTIRDQTTNCYQHYLNAVAVRVLSDLASPRHLHRPLLIVARADRLGNLTNLLTALDGTDSLLTVSEPDLMGLATPDDLYLRIADGVRSQAQQGQS